MNRLENFIIKGEIFMDKLDNIARKIRRDIIEMIGKAGSGHPGGSLSAVEIITLLYFEVMNVNAENPKDPDRDRFVLSKGHAAPALYSALANKGYFDPKELDHLRQVGAMLQGHPDMKKTPGIDISTGSLGQGFSASVGMALGAHIDHKDYQTYVVLGDGELEEGMVWEAAMAAAHYKLDNLTAFVDNNNLQIDGPITKVMSPYPIDEKFAAFGWHVINIADGNNIEQLRQGLKEAQACTGKPSVLICKTVKGKGVSFMENQVGWHGKGPNAEEVKIALSELED